MDSEQAHTDYKLNFSRAVIFRGLFDLVHRDLLRENDGEATISLWKHHMLDFYNQRANGPVDAYLRSAAYTNKHI